MKKTYKCICSLKEHTIDLNLATPVWRYVVETIETMGETIQISIPNGKCYLVQRIYVAFHGVRARDLPILGFPEVVSPSQK